MSIFLGWTSLDKKNPNFKIMKMCPSDVHTFLNMNYCMLIGWREWSGCRRVNADGNDRPSGQFNELTTAARSLCSSMRAHRGQENPTSLWPPTLPTPRAWPNAFKSARVSPWGSIDWLDRRNVTKDINNSRVPRLPRTPLWCHSLIENPVPFVILKRHHQSLWDHHGGVETQHFYAAQEASQSCYWFDVQCTFIRPERVRKMRKTHYSLLSIFCAAQNVKTLLNVQS